MKVFQRLGVGNVFDTLLGLTRGGAIEQNISFDILSSPNRMRTQSHRVTLALLVGTGGFLVFQPSAIRKFWLPEPTVRPGMGAAVPLESSGSGEQGSAESNNIAVPRNPWLMTAGYGLTDDGYEETNSAVSAGLPAPEWFRYQSELARLVVDTSRAQSDPVRVQGAGNRFTQAEIDAMKAGVTAVFTDLENSLVDQVFGEQLPLVGDGFQVAWVNNVTSFRHLETMRTAITNALHTFTGSADYDPAVVATAIRNQLVSFDASTTVTSSTPGDQARIDFVSRRDYAVGNVPVAADFGFPALDMERAGTTDVSTTASVQFNFAIGVDAEGFYLETAGSNFTFNTTTSGAGINTIARLAKLDHNVTDNPANPTTQTLDFNIQLKEPSGDGKLRVGELQSQPDLLDATVSGTTRTALKLVSEMPNSVLFPRVGTDFTIQWDFENAVVDPDDDNLSFGSQPLLTLNNNRVLLDSFLNEFASGVLEKIRDVTQPVQPVIDVLGAPIPLLSDLGSSDVTLLDIFGLPQETQDAVNSLSRISNLANLAQGLAAGGMSMDLGDWSFAPDDPRVDGPDELTGFSTRSPSSNVPAPLAEFLTEADKITGLDFPILKNGKPVVDMLLGRNASLFTYQSGKIEISEDFGAYFPVLGPIGVTLGGEIGFGAEFGFGYDTQGMFDYFAGGSSDTSLLANGFYAMALDEQGNPLTGVELYGEFTAGVELNVIIASAGVEGRIGASLGIYLNDQIGDEDGRVRFDDFASLSIDEWFYAYGRLYAGIRAYLEIGWPPFGIEFEFESPEVTLLSFDSRPDNTPILAMLTPSNLSQLELNVGERAPLRIHGDALDIAENYLISSQTGLNGPELVVEAFGAVNVISPLPTKIIGHAKERGDSLEIESSLDIDAHLTGGLGPDLLRGGGGDDLLEGGEGPDTLRGFGGFNTLRGGEDNDTLVGAGGIDVFDGGPGIDTAAWSDAPAPMTMDLRTMTFAGAAANATLLSIERYRGSPFPDLMDGSDGDDQLIDGDRGNDILRGHDGRDLLMGGPGEDTIEGGDGDDQVMGGPGADNLDGGPGTDTLSFLLAETPVSASLLTGVGLRGEAFGDTYANFESLVGTGLPKTSGVPEFGIPAEESGDLLHGDHGPNTIYGMDGADEIHGHGGDDILYGNHPDSPESKLQPILPGFEADKILGGDGNDTLHGHGDDDLLDGELGADTLLGGTGNDHLIDLDPASPDLLDGGDGFDLLTADFSTATAGITFIVGQENSGASPGGDQFHRMESLGDFTTGSGNDVIRLAASPEPKRYDKTIVTGSGNDLIVADTRTSYVPGGRTQDSLHGGEGIDTLSFENSIAGVGLNLANNAATGAAAEMTISGFEHLIGSDFDDTFSGNAANNFLSGGGGDDFLSDLNPASIDLLDGGDGHDRLSGDYSNKTESVQFTVGQENSMTFAGGETYHRMETLGQFFTGPGDDIIRLAAVPEAERFNKTIDAGPGNDLVIADSRHVYGALGRSNDTLHGGDGIDTLSFEQSTGGVLIDPTGHLAGLGYPRLGWAAAGMTISGFENLIGSNSWDILVGDAGDNIITPLNGLDPSGNIDEVYGLGGIDTLVLDYSQEPLANVHGMVMPTSSGSFGTISVKNLGVSGRRHLYSSIEQFHITGSDGPDSFYGELVASRNDIFLGRGGNDLIYGRFGADWIDGGEGNDQLFGESGNDTILGGPGNDHIELGLADSPALGYGIDIGDGGDGDDFVSLHYSPGFDNTYAIASDVMKLDGGPGFDILTLDAGHIATPIHWDDENPTDLVLPNGGYARNFERIRDINTGSGNDVIICRGRYDNKISVRGGDDIVNPGLGIDIVQDSSGGFDTLILDYSQGDDPDLGGATNSSQAAAITRRRLSDNAIIDSINGFFNGLGFERFEFTGGSKNDVIHGTPGVNFFYGNGGNDTFHGQSGNDWLDGGPGADTLHGGWGNDIYIVDDPGDQALEPTGGAFWQAGNDTVRSSVDFTLGFYVENLQLTGDAISGTGNEISNSLTGNTRNNTLSGGAGNDTLNGGGGAGEIDTLNGGADADTFVLGLLGSRFYDDGNASTPGHDGHAIITDFTPSQSDRLRLAGAAAQYLLGVSPFDPDDDALYHDSNGNATLDASDELIAILQSAETLSIANTITNAVYQNSVAPSVVGLTAAPVASVENGGSGPRLSAAFSILETPPSNVRIEVIASNDLGIEDPWTVIATKTGNGAWSGPAQVTTSPAGSGRVSVSVADVPQTPRPPRRFMAIRLVPL
jgi:Ca2+-binding RTX toxin-like protein